MLFPQTGVRRTGCVGSDWLHEKLLPSHPPGMSLPQDLRSGTKYDEKNGVLDRCKNRNRKESSRCFPSHGANQRVTRNRPKLPCIQIHTAGTLAAKTGHFDAWTEKRRSRNNAAITGFTYATIFSSAGSRDYVLVSVHPCWHIQFLLSARPSTHESACSSASCNARAFRERYMEPWVSFVVGRVGIGGWLVTDADCARRRPRTADRADRPDHETTRPGGAASGRAESWGFGVRGARHQPARLILSHR